MCSTQPSQKSLLFGNLFSGKCKNQFVKAVSCLLAVSKKIWSLVKLIEEVFELIRKGDRNVAWCLFRKENFPCIMWKQVISTRIIFTGNIWDFQNLFSWNNIRAGTRIWGHPVPYPVGNGLGLYLNFSYLIFQQLSELLFTVFVLKLKRSLLF